MIELTAPNGTVVEIDPDHFDYMYPNKGDWTPKAKAVVVLDDGTRYAVCETTEEIDNLIQG